MTAPDPRLDRVTKLSRQLVEQAGAVALETNDDIDRGSFDYAKWAKSMLKLWDLSLTSTLELAPDMFVPCTLPCLQLPSDEPEQSEYITVTPRDVVRKLSVVPDSFKHDGTPSFGIPDYLLHIDPPKLRPNATQFRITVLWPGLRSGTYRGAVRLVPEASSTVVIDEIVPVIIDL